MRGPKSAPLSQLLLILLAAGAAYALSQVVAGVHNVAMSGNETDGWSTYGTARRELLRSLFGIDVGQYWSAIELDFALLWLTAFAALNVFTFRFDGLLVWGHIRENSCRLVASEGWRRGLCVLVKWAWCLLLAPLFLAYAWLRSRLTPQRFYTAFGVTVSPSEVGKYIKTVAWLTALFMIVTIAIGRRSLSD